MSTDLIHWTGVMTNVLNSSGLYNFIELDASNHPRRFYLGRHVP